MLWNFSLHPVQGVLLCLMLLTAGLTPVSAVWGAPPVEDPEESDFPPGLLATYRAGTQEVQRIDPDISFDWGNSRPDSRLPAGEFSAEWSGYFLMKGSGEYRFHAYLQGELEIVLNDQVVLRAESAEAGWVSGELETFRFGELPLVVRYRRTGKEGIVKLFWSSPQFAIEPVSTYLLFREAGDPDLARQEQGRLATRAWRCDACHDRNAATAPLSAPGLEQAGTHLSADWMIQKLTQPAIPGDHMPEFGLTTDEAAEIVAYLGANSKTGPKLKTVTSKKMAEDRAAGELLARTTGCLACHKIGELGQQNEFGGARLDAVGQKRSGAWLAHWLKSPEELNPTHRMPRFELAETEIRQLAIYLESLKGPNAVAADKSASPSAKSDLAARGKALIETHRCAACHAIPGIKSPKSAPAINPAKLTAGCLRETTAATPGSAGQSPAPRFSQAPRAEIRSWLATVPQTSAAGKDQGLESVSTFARGSDLLIEKNCLACHSRDRIEGNVALSGQVAGVDSRLTGQSQGLIPPHLTAVGDRLQDVALVKAIAGEQPRRLPWLSVRMPRFTHTPVESRELTHFLIAHDRLPGPVPDERLQLTDSTLTRSEELLLGRELSGGRAFNCIACHKMGEYEPRNTALGTRGSDLLGVAGRLRPEYFLRWTRSPIRVVPGMEMPSYNQPRAGFAVHGLDDQLSTLWRAFNDPTFKAPSNPTIVEQFLVVGPDQPARVIRDVFELRDASTKDRVFVSRPFAVGLNNGHSLLFDLDQGSLRGWAFGDFAYQQTEGKSWYWSLAGAAVVDGWLTEPELRLRSLKEESTLILPRPDGVRQTQLKSYERTSSGVRLSYEMQFPVGSSAPIVTVDEELEPLPPQTGATGWKRRLQIRNVPAGYEPVFQTGVARGILGEPELIVPGTQFPLNGEKPITLPFVKAGAAGGDFELEMDYVARVTNRSTQPFPDKPVPAERPQEYAGIPGLIANRLPLRASIMPTALAWQPDGTLVFTSLKGQVYAYRPDAAADSGQDPLQLIEEGLAAPFGILPLGDELLVAHKPEVLALKVMPEQTRASRRRVYADGWGHSDDYHDWISGFAVDQAGQIFVGTGSNYSQKNRPREISQHRGEILQLNSTGTVETVATEHRYPIGIACDAQGRMFASDQQGVQNCFNEINHIQRGRAYGVPPLFAEPGVETPACIQIPHPWTRSVNGIFFIPEQDNLGPLQAFSGHGVGCEYNNRFLVRFSLQEVNGELQGACYELTRSAETLPLDANLLLGPMCGGVGPDGKIYLGGIHDSGWLGGQNVGEIVTLTAAPELPNGIRELRAIPGGFELEFLRELPRKVLEEPATYDISGYTRKWQGSYATPDSGRYRAQIQQIEVADSNRTVRVLVDELRPGYVYDVHIRSEIDLFPGTGYYTMNQVPQGSSTTSAKE